MSCDQSLAYGQGRRRNMTGKLVRNMGKRYRIDFSEEAKKKKSVPLDIHQRESLEEDFYNQVDRKNHSVDTSLPFSQTPLSSPSGFMNKVAKMAGMDVMHVFSNMDLHSPKPTWLWPPLCVCYASSWDQLLMSSWYSTISPGWTASYLVTDWLQQTASTMEEAIFCSYWNRNLTLDMDLPSLNTMHFCQTTICGLIEHLIHHCGVLHSIASNKKLISQQIKCNNGLLLMKFTSLNMFSTNLK